MTRKIVFDYDAPRMYDLTPLKNAMAEQGLDTLNLAKRMGRSESTIRHLFARGSGHRKNIKLIADVLGVPMKQLIGESKRKRRAA